MTKRENTTKTRTIGGITWECSESEGLWYAGKYMIGRSGRRGMRSKWELHRENISIMIGDTCGDLMDAVARNIVPQR
jgi:hypothetical protein